MYFYLFYVFFYVFYLFFICFICDFYVFLCKFIKNYIFIEVYENVYSIKKIQECGK